MQIYISKLETKIASIQKQIDSAVPAKEIPIDASPDSIEAIEHWNSTMVRDTVELEAIKTEVQALLTYVSAKVKA